jgi:hypothetical protein
VSCRECGVSENSSSKIRSVQALIQQHRRRLNGSIKTLPGHALREAPQTVWTLSFPITQSTCADVDHPIPSWDVESQIRVKSHAWRHLIDISARPRSFTTQSTLTVIANTTVQTFVFYQDDPEKGNSQTRLTARSLFFSLAESLTANPSLPIYS